MYLYGKKFVHFVRVLYVYMGNINYCVLYMFVYALCVHALQGIRCDIIVCLVFRHFILSCLLLLHSMTKCWRISTPN